MENQIEIINQRDVELLEKNRKINLQKLFTPEGMDLIIAEIQKEVADFTADIATKEGRAKIISMAAKIAKCKSPIKNLATELKEESKKLIDGVNSQWNRYEKAMDDLRDAVRKPVDEIEEKEAVELKSKQYQLGFLEHLKNYIPDNGSTKMSESYNNALKRADQLMNFDWQDFQFKADAIFDEVKNLLQSRLAFALKNEAEQAELIQLKKEKAEREKKDEEERIAKEAEERAKREAEELIKRAEKAKIDAENRAKESERLAKEQAEKAELSRIQAEIKAKEDAERLAIEAVEKERQRVAEIARKEAEATEKREANKRHRNKIHGEISIAFLEALGIYYKDVSNEDSESVENTHEMCHKIIEAISKNEIPNLTINY
jgi:hypothetical protein